MRHRRYEIATAIWSATERKDSKETKFMKRSILMSSVTAWRCLGLLAPSFAAPPPVTNLSDGDKTETAVMPAKTCLTDVRAFRDQMQKDGFWLGGSDYGYGYPLDGYGYGV